MNKNEMVSVSRETLERIIGCGKTGFPVTDVAFALLREILDMPAEQHQGDPVALPARKPITAHGLTALDSEAEGWNAYHDEVSRLGPLFTHPAQDKAVVLPALRTKEDIAKHGHGTWNQCLKEIAKLGPLYIYPASAVQKGEPIGEIVSAQDTGFRVKWAAGVWSEQLPVGTKLYTRADAGEVERLRELVKAYMTAEAEKGIELVKLRAKLAERDALLQEAKKELESAWKGSWDNVPADSVAHKIDVALSASAEPSAPKCGTCNDLGHVPGGEITDVGGVEFENGPVECLKDCPDCTPVERDGLEGVEDVAKSIGERMKSRAALERKS